MQVCFEPLHGVEEGFLLARGELVRDAGRRLGSAVQPLPDQGCLAGDEQRPVRRDRWVPGPTADAGRPEEITLGL
jgi:hypothetical protein